MIKHCEHVKANGHFCGSPAMRGRNYCYFHMVHIGRQLRLERYASHGLQAPPIELPLLEDAASIQLALMQVTEAMLHGTLDRKTAGLVLYALQTASSNLRNMQKEAEAEAGNAICNRYDSFEQDYELDEQTAAGLRVEETAEEDNLETQAAEIVEGAKYAGLIADDANQQRGKDAGAHHLFVTEDSADTPTVGPISVHDREHQDRSARIPLLLTKVQYEQAKVSIFGYEMLNHIDREHREGRKPVAQRPAISQNISLLARKPVASVRMAEESASVAEGTA